MISEAYKLKLIEQCLKRNCRFQQSVFSGLKLTHHYFQNNRKLYILMDFSNKVVHSEFEYGKEYLKISNKIND